MLKNFNIDEIWLTRPRWLWLLFSCTVLLTLCFPLIANHWELAFLDALSSPVEVRAQLMALSSSQRTVHAWSTGTLDVAYPFAYGLLFAGTALRSFGRFGPYLAVPGLLAIPVDLGEGVVQILALTEITDWLGAKVWLTPLKMSLFFGGLTISLGAWLHILIAHIRILLSNRATRNPG